MSRDKFKKVEGYLHFVDNGLITADTTDKMFKLKPLIEELQKSWQQYGIFHEDLCIDEQVTLYYDNHSSKQFIKSKPVRYGFKLLSTMF